MRAWRPRDATRTPRAAAALQSPPLPHGLRPTAPGRLPLSAPVPLLFTPALCSRSLSSLGTLRAVRRGNGCAAAGEGSFSSAPIPFVGLVSGCEEGAGVGEGVTDDEPSDGVGRAWKTCCHAACGATAPHVASSSVKPTGGASGFLWASLSQDSVVRFGSSSLPFYSRGRNSSCVTRKGRQGIVS